MSQEERGEKGRMDFIEISVPLDDETGATRLIIAPDPRRYEWRTEGGEHLLYDRSDDVHFAEGAVKKALAWAASQERPGPVPILGDIARYVADRRPEVDAILDGTAPEDGLSSAAQSALDSLVGDELGFVVMSVDIKGSSQLAADLDGPTLARLLDAFASEVSELVALFHGQVLRYEGDGLVAFFPEPSFISNNDFGVDCAVCIQRVIKETVGPALAARDLPAIEARIGIDSGDAAVKVMGSSRTRRQAELVGDVVSLAVNIEKVAAPGGICIGATAEHNLHYEWRDRCEGVAPPDDWPFTAAGGGPYGIFRLDQSAPRPIEATSVQTP